MVPEGRCGKVWSVIATVLNCRMLLRRGGKLPNSRRSALGSLLAIFLTLSLLAGAVSAPNGRALALEGPGGSDPSASAATVAYAPAEADNPAVIRQAMDVLLDRFVNPLNPADLLNAAYAGLVKSLRDAGVQVKNPGPLQLDSRREQAWSGFQDALQALEKDSPPPADLKVNGVA